MHVPTVKRRLVNFGLHGRQPARKKTLISAKSRKLRLAIAREHKQWGLSEWSKVLWSDESEFNLHSSDGLEYVRRPKYQRYEVLNQVPRVKHGGGNLILWGCFSRDGVGIMDRFGYQKILSVHMPPHARAEMTPYWLFQHDNESEHKSKCVARFLNREK